MTQYPSRDRPDPEHDPPYGGSNQDPAHSDPLKQWELASEHFSLRLQQLRKSEGEPSDTILDLARNRVAASREIFEDSSSLEVLRAVCDLAHLLMERSDLRYGGELLELAEEIYQQVQELPLQERVQFVAEYDLIARTLAQHDLPGGLEVVQQGLRLYQRNGETSAIGIQLLCSKYLMTAMHSPAAVVTTVKTIASELNSYQGDMFREALNSIFEVTSSVLSTRRYSLVSSLLEAVRPELLARADKELHVEELQLELLRAYTFASAGDTSGFINAMYSLTSAEPEDIARIDCPPGIAYAVAEACMDHSEYPLAVQLFTRAFARPLDPDILDAESLAVAFYNAGVAFSEIGKDKEAVDYYLQSHDVLASSSYLSDQEKVELLGKRMLVHAGRQHTELAEDALDRILGILEVSRAQIVEGNGPFENSERTGNLCLAAYWAGRLFQEQNFSALALGSLSRASETLHTLNDASILSVSVDLLLARLQLQEGRIDEAKNITEIVLGNVSALEQPSIDLAHRVAYQAWQVASFGGATGAVVDNRLAALMTLYENLSSEQICGLADDMNEVAVILVARGQFLESLEVSTRVSEAFSEEGDPRVFQADLYRAEAHVRLGEVELAGFLIREVISSISRRDDIPDFQVVELLVRLNELEEISGRYDLACNKLEKLAQTWTRVLRQAPDTAFRLFSALGNAYLKQGDDVNARRIALEGTRFCPVENPTYNLGFQRMKIDALLTAHNLEGARKALDTYFESVREFSEESVSVPDANAELVAGYLRMTELHVLKDDFGAAERQLRRIDQLIRHTEGILDLDFGLRLAHCKLDVATASADSLPLDRVAANALRFYEQRQGELKSLDRVKLLQHIAESYLKEGGIDIAFETFQAAISDLESLDLDNSEHMLQLLRRFHAGLDKLNDGVYDSEQAELEIRIARLESLLKD